MAASHDTATQRSQFMKQYFGLGLAMLAGTVIGAAAVSGLHAQAKPPVYLITEIDVTNPEAYGTEFAPKAQATIKAAGGRFVVIKGTTQEWERNQSLPWQVHRQSGLRSKSGTAWTQ